MVAGPIHSLKCRAQFKVPTFLEIPELTVANEAPGRALGDLTRGLEARPSDKELFGGDPHMNLRYWDARDEAVARYGNELAWQPDEHSPDGEGEGE